MGLGKSIGKLDDYYERLAQQKAGRIKPDHVDKVLGKLRVKETELKADIADTEKPEKKQRLEAKLDVVQKQIQRGEWLRDKIRDDAAGD